MDKSNADENGIAQWIVDLDNDNFEVREKATEELKKAGDQTWPALRKVLAGDAPLETKTRARRLLELRFNFDPDRVRLIRTLELLEDIKSKEAVGLLQTLASGAPQAWLTQEAKRMLQRMALND